MTKKLIYTSRAVFANVCNTLIYSVLRVIVGGGKSCDLILCKRTFYQSISSYRGAVPVGHGTLFRVVWQGHPLRCPSPRQYSYCRAPRALRQHSLHPPHHHQRRVGWRHDCTLLNQRYGVCCNTYICKNHFCPAVCEARWVSNRKQTKNKIYGNY